jgi:hypothetical protein
MVPHTMIPAFPQATLVALPEHTWYNGYELLGGRAGVSGCEQVLRQTGSSTLRTITPGEEKGSCSEDRPIRARWQ